MKGGYKEGSERGRMGWGEGRHHNEGGGLKEKIEKEVIREIGPVSEKGRGLKYIYPVAWPRGLEKRLGLVGKMKREIHKTKEHNGWGGRGLLRVPVPGFQNKKRRGASLRGGEEAKEEETWTKEPNLKKRTLPGNVKTRLRTGKVRHCYAGGGWSGLPITGRPLKSYGFSRRLIRGVLALPRKRWVGGFTTHLDRITVERRRGKKNSTMRNGFL